MKFNLFLLMLFACTAAHASVKTYDYPEGKEGLTLMHDFSVCADGHPIKTYMCEVNPHRRVQKASWCQFEVIGNAKIQVTRRGEKVNSASVRPLSKSIKYTLVNDSTMEFTVPQVKDNSSYALEVDINGDRDHCLHIFIDGPEQEVYEAPSPDSMVDINWKTVNNHDVFVQNPHLIYFGPGLHKPHDLPSAEIKIPSNATVYLAPGAVVRARLIVDRAENVRIIGRGVLLSPLRGVEITYSRNVEIDGLTIINPQHYTVYGGQSSDITIRNIRSFSRHPWSDGIDMMCCKNVTVEDVFLRNNDDAFAIYNHRWWYWGGSENYHIRRATIFSDLAHPFNIASHGDDRSDNGELLHNIWVEDCDILSADGDGIMAFSCGDKNRVEDVHFKNIRIEDVVSSALFKVMICFSDKYNRAPGNYVRNIWFEDIYFNGDETHLKPNIFKNYDDTHTVSDLHFDNIRINGKKIHVSQ
ncbi:MAG: glycosyl hydrolase family 28 protein [Prevotellaceae bacterium]|nr:glycosyl hydrolase family 28 protein [Prevotellaceae bacterium]